MKKIAFQLFLLLIPCMMTAQSEWEVPDAQKPSSSTSQKKAKEGKDDIDGTLGGGYLDGHTSLF